MAALRSNLNRYHSYSNSSIQRDDSSPEREQLVSSSSDHSAVNGMREPQARASTSGRLEHIINSMAYIRGELVSQLEDACVGPFCPCP